MRRICGPNGQEVTGGWKKWNLVKKDEMGREGMEEKRNAYEGRKEGYGS
jgi:hypothetical protein